MEAAQALRRRLGLLLVERGVLTAEELSAALEEQRAVGGLLGDVLIRLGFASRPAIQDALAEQSGVLFEPESGFGSGLREEIARRHEERRAVHRGPEEAAPPEPGDLAAPLFAIEGGLAPPLRAHEDAAELQAPPEPLPGGEIRIRYLEETLARREERLAALEGELAALRSDARDLEPPAAHLLFFKGEDGYRLVDADGPPPRPGDEVVPPGAGRPFAVLKVGPAPLPGDVRPCAFLEPPPDPAA